MINELPKTEIVALYVFAHFILMEKPIDFIINNQIIEDDYLMKIQPMYLLLLLNSFYQPLYFKRSWKKVKKKKAPD